MTEQIKLQMIHKTMQWTHRVFYLPLSGCENIFTESQTLQVAKNISLSSDDILF